MDVASNHDGHSEYYLSFAGLAGMPPVNHHDYAAAWQGMIDEILNSNTLETYLIVSNQLYDRDALLVSL
jgi:hypothetical protein